MRIVFASLFVSISLITCFSAASISRSWAQGPVDDYYCAEGDMRCLREDIYKLDWCPITYKKMALSADGEATWFVSTDRGGGWVPVIEFYARHDAMLRMRGKPTVSEMLELWNGNSGVDEVNACEHTHFWHCYLEREATRGDLVGCKQEAMVETEEHIAITRAAAEARARATAGESEHADPSN